VAGTGSRTFFRHGLEPFEVGRDSITPVDPAYEDRAVRVHRTIDKVTFTLIKN
jgi:arylsulfatase